MDQPRTQDRPPARRAQLVEIDLEKLTRRHIPKGRTLRAKALRALAGFLAVMVLFTLLSRAADELTIAKADAKEAQRQSIDHKVTASGQVEENGAKTLSTLPGVRVSEIAVKEGGKAQKDAPLFKLNEEDLREKLESVQEELEKLDLDIRDQESRQSLEASDRSTALVRAQQDYADAKEEADKSVSRAREALDKAQARLNEALNSAPDLDALRAACDTKQKALSDAQTALSDLQAEVEQKVLDARAAGEDPDAAEAEVRAQYQSALDAASAKAVSAQEEKQAADDALANAENSGSQVQALRDGVDSAQDAYDQALTARDNSLKSAQRAIEDAQKGTPSDSTSEKNALARKELQEQIGEIEALLEDGGVVRAPSDGVVTKLSVEVGAPTPEGTAALLADSTQGRTFVAQVPADQEKYLAAGMEVLLKPGGDKKDITGLTVESIGKNAENADLLDVAVRLPEGSLEIGDSATMEAVQKSKDYSQCVPLSALHEENGTYYLLVPRETAGILGTETTAERLNVEIVEKNETYAALTEGILAQGQKFLTDSSKPVGAGDRIRLNET